MPSTGLLVPLYPLVNTSSPSSSSQPAITEPAETSTAGVSSSNSIRRTRTASHLSDSDTEVAATLQLPSTSQSQSRIKRRKRDHHQSVSLGSDLRSDAMHSSSGQASTSYANGNSSNGVAGPSSPGKQRGTSNGSSSYSNGHASTSASAFQPIYPGSQIDRQELVRLALQCLQDANYPQAVAALSKESGYTLESPTITTFRNGVLDGKWETVMRLLKDEEIVAGETLKVLSANPMWSQL